MEPNIKAEQEHSITWHGGRWWKWWLMGAGRSKRSWWCAWHGFFGGWSRYWWLQVAAENRLLTVCFFLTSLYDPHPLLRGSCSHRWLIYNKSTRGKSRASWRTYDNWVVSFVCKCSSLTASFLLNIRCVQIADELIDPFKKQNTQLTLKKQSFKSSVELLYLTK